MTQGYPRGKHGEDRYFPLAQELDWLSAAGFPHPDCVFRRGIATVYGGFA